MSKPSKSTLITVGLMLIVLATLTQVLIMPVHPQVVSERGIFIRGDEAVTVDGRNMILTGDIIIGGNGILTLRGSTIQLSIRAEEDYNVTVSENGRLILEDSTLTSLSETSHVILTGNASLIVSPNSRVNGFEALRFNDTSTLIVRVGKLEVERLEGELKMMMLENAENPEGEIHVKTDTFNVTGFNGAVANVSCNYASLIESKFESLAVNASESLEASKIEAEEATIVSAGELRLENSTFGELTMGGVGEVYNVLTTSGKATRAGGQILALQDSIVERFWYLSVNVTDVAGVDVPALISISDMNGTRVYEFESDITGMAYASILAEVISYVNASETRFVGNYIIGAAYAEYSTPSKPLTMDSNKEVGLIFEQIIPLPTTTHIRLSKIKMRVGDKLIVSGSIDQPIGGALIEVTYENPFGEKVLRAVTTAEDGSFSSEFTPNVVGEWTVFADWLGGSAFAGGKLTASRPSIFIVEERPTIQMILIRTLPILIIVVAVIIGLAYLALHRRVRKIKR